MVSAFDDAFGNGALMRMLEEAISEARLMFGVWCLVFGVEGLVFGVWCLVFGVWCLVVGG
jgi:hypothetical protein